MVAFHVREPLNDSAGAPPAVRQVSELTVCGAAGHGVHARLREDRADREVPLLTRKGGGALVVPADADEAQACAQRCQCVVREESLRTEGAVVEPAAVAQASP